MSMKTSIALWLFVSGCASSGTMMDKKDDMTVTPKAGSALVRVVHASPDAPAVDVWAKGVDRPLLTNLHYGDTSAYLSLPAGTYDIQIRKSPSSASDSIVFDSGDLAIPENVKISAPAGRPGVSGRRGPRRLPFARS